MRNHDLWWQVPSEAAEQSFQPRFASAEAGVGWLRVKQTSMGEFL